MTRIIVHSDATALPRAAPDQVPVWLYGSRPPGAGSAAIGGSVLKEIARVQTRVSESALDFVSLALAVTAADTFSPRDVAPDGWARTIDLTVALHDPARWQPTTALLARMLRFLSGDNWTIQIVGGGEAPPAPRPRVRRKILLDACDSACLYSGGLDSAVGVLDLKAQGRRPVLVSHAYAGDASRQLELMRVLGLQLPRFGAIASPTRERRSPNDVQMRTRSFNFLAMGAMMATAVHTHIHSGTPIPLVVPENGLIAINPPLTTRRIGALSTRTTHPHYLHMVQELMGTVGLPVTLVNPFAHTTKGEMIRACKDQASLKRIAARTVSCGHWKRTGVQCGRCVPCLIRRASFHAAGWPDRTQYSPFGQTLAAVLGEGGPKADDLMAMVRAANKLGTTDVARWIAATGPLPADPGARAALTAVVARGMDEVWGYLNGQRLLR